MTNEELQAGILVLLGVCVSLPYSEAFTMVILEPQGSSLDIGHCSTVGACRHFAFPLTKMLTGLSWILLANYNIKSQLNP